MMTLLFTILMIIVFSKILLFAVQAAWGVSKIVVSLVLLPVFLVGLVLVGFVKLAFPILLIVGGISLLTLHD